MQPIPAGALLQIDRQNMWTGGSQGHTKIDTKSGFGQNVGTSGCLWVSFGSNGIVVWVFCLMFQGCLIYLGIRCISHACFAIAPLLIALPAPMLRQISQCGVLALTKSMLLSHDLRWRFCCHLGVPNLHNIDDNVFFC